MKKLYLLYLHAVAWPKKTLLRICGLKVGKRVYIHPSARFSWLTLKYMELGDDVEIHEHCQITIEHKNKDAYLFIGKGTRIGHHVEIFLKGTMYIGPGCLIASFSHMSDCIHDMSKPADNDMKFAGRVTIGARVFMGKHVLITPGVTVGDDVRIGGNSVVTRDAPDGSVFCGNPAEVKRYIYDDKN